MPKVFHYQANCEPFATQAAGGEVQTLDRWQPIVVGKTRRRRRFSNPGREAYLTNWSVLPWWAEEGEGLMVTARATALEVTARATAVLVPARATTVKANA